MAYRDVILADSPAAYHRLGESSGTVAVDASSSALNGTYEGTHTKGVTGALLGGRNAQVERLPRRP